MVAVCRFTSRDRRVRPRERRRLPAARRAYVVRGGVPGALGTRRSGGRGEQFRRRGGRQDWRGRRPAVRPACRTGSGTMAAHHRLVIGSCATASLQELVAGELPAGPVPDRRRRRRAPAPNARCLRRLRLWSTGHAGRPGAPRGTAGSPGHRPPPAHARRPGTGAGARGRAPATALPYRANASSPPGQRPGARLAAPGLGLHPTSACAETGWGAEGAGCCLPTEGMGEVIGMSGNGKKTPMTAKASPGCSPRPRRTPPASRPRPGPLPARSRRPRKPPTASGDRPDLHAAQPVAVRHGPAERRARARTGFRV